VAPTELCLIGGEPGVGKSALTWEMALGFARKQMVKPKDKRIGTLVLSLEMALIGSSARLATSMAGVESTRLREGDISDDELNKIIRTWKNHEHLPMYWNFASNFRFSQLRALVVEAIRRYNVGVIIIDHFRMFDPDRRINNANQEDEAKARFLKESIAKDLNVAVICLAHTVKLRRELSDGRPHLSDLRGSGQVAAHADIVGFMYRPWMYATENEKLDGVISPTEAELIFRKNRNGALGTSEFFFDPGTMNIRDPLL
jgi:replicative DNA helicase